MKSNLLSAAMISTLASVFASGCMMSADEIDSYNDEEMVGTAEEAITPGADVWKGDVRVTISAVKDSANQRITYTMTAKNYGDDDARNVIISHTPSYELGLVGMSLVSVSASHTTCTGSYQGIALSVVCNPITLGVGVTETVTVVINNVGNSPRTGTVQAMGITPDPNPSNNFASIDVL